MKPWRSILGSYLVRWQFWAFSLLWLSQMAGYLGNLSRGRGPDTARLLLFGTGYAGAALGIHVKEQFAAYRARLVPGFREAHLVVAGAFLALMIVPFAVIGKLYGTSLSGALGLVFPMAALFFTFGVRGGKWGMLVAVTCIGVMVPHVSTFLAAVAAGEQPVVAWAGIAVGLLELGRAFRFLWTMDEETPGYEWQFRSNLRRPAGGVFRRQVSAQLRYLDGRKSIWLRMADWSVPDVMAPIGASRLRRVLHWRRAQGNWAVSMAMPAMVWAIMLLLGFAITRSPTGFGNPLMTTCWVPLGMPQMCFFGFWQSHYALISRELIYPVRRRDYLLEQGLGILALQYLMWLVLMLELLAVNALRPEALSTPQLALYILFTGAWQLPALGVSMRMATVGSGLGGIIGYIVATAVGTPVLIILLRRSQAALAPEAVGAVGGAVLLGAALLVAAYRYWKRTDIG